LWYGLPDYPAGVATTLHSFDLVDRARSAPRGAYPVDERKSFRDNLGRRRQQSGHHLRVTVSGRLTTPYSFLRAALLLRRRGRRRLIQPIDGNFYCTTSARGASSVGTVAPSGALKTLCTFCPQGSSCTNGKTRTRPSNRKEPYGRKKSNLARRTRTRTEHLLRPR